MTEFMQEALKQARAAAARGEVPVGAVIVKDGKIIATGGNETENANDPTAHAEIIALRRACEKENAPRLPDCDLYVTLEPCPLCAAAISFARIRRVYFGAYDPHHGKLEHKPDVYGGIAEGEAAALLKDFFKDKR